MGPMQPRNGHVISRFFRQFQEEDRGRLLYAENIKDPNEALGLLGTVLLDRRLSKEFFQDSRRMEKDLLGGFS